MLGMTKALRIAAAVIGLVFATGAAQAQPVPNIVFIMADDLGWSDTSNSLTNMGNPSSFFQTPTLERLAGEGISFTHAYTNGSSCAPTRAALLTGLYASRRDNYIFSFASGGLNRGYPLSLLEGPPQGLPVTELAQIPDTTFTVAEMLKGAGYATAHLGKFHVGDPNTSTAPLNQGFDFNYGGGKTGAPGAYHANLNDNFGAGVGTALDPFGAPYTQLYIDDNIKPYSSGLSDAQIDALVGTAKHVSDAMVDAAIEFMDAHNSQPFYLQHHQYAVHTPIDDAQARLDLLAKYQALPPVDDGGDGNEIPSYAALIEGIDQSVARLIDYLETTPDPRNPGQNLDQNTMVIFYSDNGGKENQAYNGPLRGSKGDFEEGGIRVPMIAWSANTNLVAPSTPNPNPVISIDFYPTFAELANADTTGLVLDGESLAPILNGTASTLNREAIFWHFPGYFASSQHNQTPRSLIHKGPWKMYYDYEDLSFALYNLDNDINEAIDVSALHPEIVVELGIDLMKWLDETDAPLAMIRSEFGSVILTVSGVVYSNGQITRLDDETITVQPGEEKPMVMHNILSCEQVEAMGFPEACSAGCPAGGCGEVPGPEGPGCPEGGCGEVPGLEGPGLWTLALWLAIAGAIGIKPNS